MNPNSVAARERRVLDAADLWHRLWIHGRQRAADRHRRDTLHTRIDNAQTRLLRALDLLAEARKKHEAHMATFRKRSQAALRGARRRRLKNAGEVARCALASDGIGSISASGGGE